MVAAMHASMVAFDKTVTFMLQLDTWADNIVYCICRGFPFWLHLIPGIQFRTTNAPFKVHSKMCFFVQLFIFSIFPSNVERRKTKAWLCEDGQHWKLCNFSCLIPLHDAMTCYLPVQNEMELFLAKIVNMMKEQKLFASQGGPIILAQVILS